MIIAGMINKEGEILEVNNHVCDLGKKRLNRLLKHDVRFRVFKDQQKIVYETLSDTLTPDQRDVMLRYMRKYPGFKVLAQINYTCVQANPWSGEPMTPVRAFIRFRTKV